MKLMQYFILAMLVIGLLLGGCSTGEQQKLAAEKKDQAAQEDSGISDVFEDSEGISPPPPPT
jgi:uncharacterized protein YceK